MCVTASYWESIQPIGLVHINCFPVTQRKGVTARDKNTKALVCGLQTWVQWLIRMNKSPHKLHPCTQMHVRLWCYQIVSCSLALSATYCAILSLCVFLCVRFLHRGLDLVNIHLFHDASNLIACNSSPSIYSANRKNALRYVINRSDHSDEKSSIVYLCKMTTNGLNLKKTRHNNCGTDQWVDYNSYSRQFFLPYTNKFSIPLFGTQGP